LFLLLPVSAFTTEENYFLAPRTTPRASSPEDPRLRTSLPTPRRKRYYCLFILRINKIITYFDLRKKLSSEYFMYISK